MECGIYADAIMEEGVNGNFETQKYLCLHKPLLIHSYPTTPLIAEKIMRSCILSGAGWSFGGSSTLTYPAWTPEVAKIYNDYLPLAKAVFGAEILLTPNPLQIKPADMVKAEIFRSRQKNEYLIGVVFERDTTVPNVELSVKVPEKCTCAEILKPGVNAWEELCFKVEKDRIIFSLTENIHCCVIRLFYIG
jgi:hypothetical protein